MEKIKNILKTTLLENGIEKQSIIAMEELSELQKAISKAARGKLDKENMAEEIADVYIIIMQMEMFYNISVDDVEKWLTVKIDRLENDLKARGVQIK